LALVSSGEAASSLPFLPFLSLPLPQAKSKNLLFYKDSLFSFFGHAPSPL
jgi:hypothetical protein